jgi:hypothetical protein
MCLKHKFLKFGLRGVSNNGAKSYDGMKKKKIGGIEIISQENIIHGAIVLVIPFTRIINNNWCVSY